MEPQAGNQPTGGEAAQPGAQASRGGARFPLRLVALVVVSGLALWLAGRILLIVFAAVLVALFLCGLSDWLGKLTHLSRRWSLLIVVFVILAALWGLGSMLAPRIALQIDELSVSLPDSLARWTQHLQQYGWGRYLLRQVSSSVAQDRMLLTRVGRVFSFTANALIDLGLALILGMYLAASAPRYEEGVLSLLPSASRDRAREVMRVAAHTLRGWMYGQMISMASLALFAFLGLTILGIPLALTLALFTGVLTFIPNLGPIISVFPPLVLALGRSFTLGVYVALFYLVLQNVEGYLITPSIQNQVIHIPPALLISNQILFATLIGFLGLVLAAPLTALGMVLVKMLYQEDVLGESVNLPGYCGGKSPR